MEVKVRQASDIKVVNVESWFGGANPSGAAVAIMTEFPVPKIVGQPSPRSPPQMGLDHIQRRIEVILKFTPRGLKMFSEFLANQIKTYDEILKGKGKKGKADYIG